jgi:hypothetical protein
VRVVYKAPASAPLNEVVIRGGNPWAQSPRIHVIIIKGHKYGF